MTKRAIKTLFLDETGVTSIEYSFMTTLIAVLCLLVITMVGNNLNLLYQLVCGEVAQAAGGNC